MTCVSACASQDTERPPELTVFQSSWCGLCDLKTNTQLPDFGYRVPQNKIGG
jgi:hypothetical protein